MQLARQRLTSLKGVGEKQAEKLGRLGLHVVEDLLFHLPLRYQDKTRLHSITQLLPGQEAQIEGEITAHHLTQSRNSSLIVTVVGADGGRLTLRFFHFGFRQAQQFKRGSQIRAFGEVRSGPTGLEMVHPNYRLFAAERRPPLETTLTPVYPATEGLGQPTLLKLIKQAMALLQQYPLDEGLPQTLLSRWRLPPIHQALTTLHQPQPTDDLAALKAFTHPAQARLIFEELLTHQLSMQWLRQQEQTRFAPPIGASQRVNQLLASLPFALTGAQTRVWAAIEKDLKQAHPMQRLVQGDVGSGKTIVAAMAAIQAADAGFQVAVMAPTEILAEQHRNHFAEWLEPLELELAWLNGRLKSADKRHQLARIENGDAKIVVGTHALFQKEVTFDRLGLVIIDEQHRFGVHQRLALHDKGLDGEVHPHQLIMTATPIPRTLAMSAYGDLDLSVIDQLPPGRQPVDTAVLNQSKREAVMAHLVTQCEQGVQAYWVCPLIEESDQLDAQAAEVTAEQFQQRWPNLRLGLMHGRMKGGEKARIMAAFQAHQLDLLVATTVIEVGVNVPNASLMIIENAERLGLAQLHQLRGRVGRGAKKSYCVLLYKPPLSETGKARLNIMRETHDGFVIAEEDLKLRGPGEVLGTRQTGGLQFRIADLERDQAWLDQAREAAMTVLNQTPEAGDCLHQRWLGEKMGYQHA